jgi:hypothetical protein
VGGGAVGGSRGFVGGGRVGGYGYGRGYGYGYGRGYGFGGLYLGFGGYPYYGYGYGYPYGYAGYGGCDPYYYDCGYGADYGYSTPSNGGAYSQQGYPQQAYPQQSYPQQNYPQQAYPPQSYPQTAPQVNAAPPAGVPSATNGFYQAPDFYLIALSDKTIQAAVAYRVEGDTLFYTTREHVEKQVPLSSVDRRFSEQINRDRHVEFHKPEGLHSWGSSKTYQKVPARSTKCK